MKKALPACLLAAALLNSCSLLQRNPSEPAPERDGPEAPFAAEVNHATPVTDATAPNYEAEISRMQTKIAALETKVDVLTANLEKSQLKSAQPVIEAGAAPRIAAAAVTPSEDLGEPPFEPAPAAKASTVLPAATKVSEAPASEAEKDFRAAMDLFQAGQNLEASSRFALFAKKYPRHLLASHALYWAGEAGARGQQWSLAVQNWQELEQSYPRSAYIAESLAGLARAYEKMGDTARAQGYKNRLLHSYPKSPVAVALNSGGQEVSGTVHSRAQFNEHEEPAPAFGGDDQAPAGEGSDQEAATE